MKYYDYLETPLGTIRIICGDEYLISIDKVDYKGEVCSNDITKLVKTQLDEYFLGKRVQFDVPINFNDTFSSRVQEQLYYSDYGELLTYKDLASRVGTKAYRAVGSAMATNPYFIVVP